jgi:hypothetical protein
MREFSAASVRAAFGAKIRLVKRATVTIPDDLAAAVQGYVQSQKTPPPLTTVIRTALRQYVTGQDSTGSISSRSGAPLQIRTARRGSGLRDVSQEPDRELAGK